MKVTLSLKADPADAVHVSFTSAAAETRREKRDSEGNVSILVLEFSTASLFHDMILTNNNLKNG